MSDALLEQIIQNGYMAVKYDNDPMEKCRDQVMRYLTRVDPSSRTFIAYRFLCIKENDDQYINDGTGNRIHLLSQLITKADEYGAIFLLSGGDIDVPIEFGADPSTPRLQTLLLRSIVRLHTDRTYATTMKVICNITLNDGEILTDAMKGLIIQANSKRLFSHLPDESDEMMLNYAIEIDNVQAILKYSVESNLMPKLTTRMEYLAGNAPIYWDKYARGVYKDLLQRLNTRQDLSRDDVVKISRLVPGVYPMISDEFTDLAYKVAILPENTRNYILGFPIHRGSPTDETIHAALIYLSRHGKTEYAKLIRSHAGSASIVPMPEVILRHGGNGGKMERCNNEDILLEDVLDYNLFDRLSFVIGMKIYTFTRPGFDNIKKTGLNPWTNVELPLVVKSEISHRIKLAKKLGLPESSTILDLLTRVEEGKLAKEKSEESSQSPGPQGRDSSDLNSLFSNMLAAQLLSTMFT
jgi:hypothetical protein